MQSLRSGLAVDVMMNSGQNFASPSKMSGVNVLSPLKYDANYSRAKAFAKRKTTLANEARQTLQRATDNSPSPFRSTKRADQSSFTQNVLSLEGKEMPVNMMPHKLVPIEHFEHSMMKVPERSTFTFMGIENTEPVQNQPKRPIVSKLRSKDMTETIRTRIMQQEKEANAKLMAEDITKTAEKLRN